MPRPHCPSVLPVGGGCCFRFADEETGPQGEAVYQGGRVSSRARTEPSAWRSVWGNAATWHSGPMQLCSGRGHATRAHLQPGRGPHRPAMLSPGLGLAHKTPAVHPVTAAPTDRETRPTRFLFICCFSPHSRARDGPAPGTYALCSKGLAILSTRGPLLPSLPRSPASARPVFPVNAAPASALGPGSHHPG